MEQNFTEAQGVKGYFRDYGQTHTAKPRVALPAGAWGGWDSPTCCGPPSRKDARGFESHMGAMQMAPSFRVRNKKAPIRELFYYYWRRGWDSNPRYDLTYA